MNTAHATLMHLRLRSVPTRITPTPVGVVALKTSPLSGGRHHLSYNGHPLYRYAGDRGAGRTTGHGVEDKWGNWHLMSIEGNAYGGQLPSQ
ncbi:hypothetical protein [Pseudoxanthomonas sp. UTMC 1351]|uniref:hypothetical protein n=1 Tax=Pseudoxanthomonas sp. UTMC 1351 TaxID=2695853 RepID=UPI0034CD4EA9